MIKGQKVKIYNMTISGKKFVEGIGRLIKCINEDVGTNSDGKTVQRWLVRLNGEKLERNVIKQ